MFEILGKAQCLDEFLQTRRDASVVSPETMALKFALQVCVDGGDFSQFLTTGCCCAQGWGDVCVFCVLCHYTMKQEDDFLGEVCYIATGLILLGEKAEKERQTGEKYLDEALTPVAIVVKIFPESVEDMDDRTLLARPCCGHCRDGIGLF